VWGDLLFINFDGFDFQYVVALDKHTGRTVWKQDRSIDYQTDNGDLKKAYSTPTVLRHEGRWQLVSPAAVGTVAYDPLTGREVWKVYHGGFNAAVRPIYTHGLVLITTERGLKLLAVRPDGQGDITETHIIWSNQKQVPSRSSPIVVGDYLYMVSDIGVASCLDVRTGETMWAERLGGKYSASPIYASGNIYFFDEEEKSYVIRANPQRLERVAMNVLENGCMASPAVLGDALIVRTKTHLYRIENRSSESAGANGRR
jgi:outer membrane protein assembly factor BamB